MASRSEDPGSQSALSRRLGAFRDGQEAEAFVEACLNDDGWITLARNWRGGGAEVDLIVARDGCVRLVEVKARQPGDASGLEAIGPGKVARLRRAGEAWLQQDQPAEIAFLVALVTLTEGIWGLELIDDAF